MGDPDGSGISESCCSRHLAVHVVRRSLRLSSWLSDNGSVKRPPLTYSATATLSPLLAIEYWVLLQLKGGARLDELTIESVTKGWMNSLHICYDFAVADQEIGV